MRCKYDVAQLIARKARSNTYSRRELVLVGPSWLFSGAIEMLQTSEVIVRARLERAAVCVRGLTDDRPRCLAPVSYTDRPEATAALVTSRLD